MCFLDHWQVGTYGGLHFLPYILPNNSESSPFVEFTPYAELFDTVYQGSVFYKSIQREEDPLLFNRIDGVIADSSITPPSFSFFSTYAFIATWTNVTICCTPKEEVSYCISSLVWFLVTRHIVYVSSHLPIVKDYIEAVIGMKLW